MFARGRGAGRSSASAAIGASSSRGGRCVLLVGLSQSRERRGRIHSPATRGRSRALNAADAGGDFAVVRKNDTGGVQSSPLGLEIVEVGRHGSRGSLAGVTALDERVSGSRILDRRTVADQSVVVGLLNPLVDDGTGPGVRHLTAEDSGLVIKGTGGRGVATCLREEDRDRIASRILLQHIVAGHGIAGVAAPLIGVQRVKVQALGRVAGARQIVLEHGPEDSNISSGVADGDFAIALLVPVRLDVPSSGKNVWGSGRTLGGG